MDSCHSSSPPPLSHTLQSDDMSTVCFFRKLWEEVDIQFEIQKYLKKSEIWSWWAVGRHDSLCHPEESFPTTYKYSTVCKTCLSAETTSEQRCWICDKRVCWVCSVKPGEGPVEYDTVCQECTYRPKLIKTAKIEFSK